MPNVYLNDLYHGDLTPNIRNYNNNEQYRAATATLESAESHLMSQLNGTNKILLTRLLSAQSEIEAVVAAECFINGFRTGANIILETLRP